MNPSAPPLISSDSEDDSGSSTNYDELHEKERSVSFITLKIEKNTHCKNHFLIRKKEEVTVAYYAFTRASEEDQLRLIHSIENQGRLKSGIPLFKSSPNDHILSIGKKDTRHLTKMEILQLIPKKKDSLMKIIIIKNPNSLDFLTQVRSFYFSSFAYYSGTP